MEQGRGYCYQIPFEILQLQGILTYKIVLERHFTIEELKDIEGVILYRCIRGNTLSLVRYARQKGIKVIYEIDDGLLNPPLNEDWGQHYIHCGIPQIIRMFLEAADLVKAGSRILAERMRVEGFASIYQPYAVLPRTIKEILKGPPYRIGYFGSFHHQKDINLIFPALLTINEALGEQVEFEFVGCAPEGWRRLSKVGFGNFEFNYELFLDDLAARQWTIGLAPLRPTHFNEAKSNSKFREYAAVGVIGIYADLAPYHDCVIHGKNGWICGSEPEDWVEVVKKIINDRFRLRMIQEARNYIGVNHNPETVAGNWMDLLDCL